MAIRPTQWRRASGGVRVSAAESAMQELEKQFADSPALLPADKEDAIRAFMKTWEAKSRSAVSLTFAASPPTEEQKPLVDALAEYLDEMEEEVKAHGGPHLFGAFSLADVTVAPFLPGLLNAEIEEINLTRHPHLAEAMRALRKRPSYQSTAVDFHTRKTIMTSFFGSGPPQVRCAPIPCAQIATQQMLLTVLCYVEVPVRQQNIAVNRSAQQRWFMMCSERTCRTCQLSRWTLAVRRLQKWRAIGASSSSAC